MQTSTCEATLVQIRHVNISNNCTLQYSRDTYWVLNTHTSERTDHAWRATQRDQTSPYYSEIRQPHLWSYRYCSKGVKDHSRPRGLESDVLLLENNTWCILCFKNLTFCRGIDCFSPDELNQWPHCLTLWGNNDFFSCQKWQVGGRKTLIFSWLHSVSSSFGANLTAHKEGN